MAAPYTRSELETLEEWASELSPTTLHTNPLPFVPYIRRLVATYPAVSKAESTHNVLVSPPRMWALMSVPVQDIHLVSLFAVAAYVHGTPVWIIEQLNRMCSFGLGFDIDGSPQAMPITDAERIGALEAAYRVGGHTAVVTRKPSSDACDGFYKPSMHVHMAKTTTRDEALTMAGALQAELDAAQLGYLKVDKAVYTGGLSLMYTGKHNDARNTHVPVFGINKTEGIVFETSQLPLGMLVSLCSFGGGYERAPVDTRVPSTVVCATSALLVGLNEAMAAAGMPAVLRVDKGPLGNAGDGIETLVGTLDTTWCPHKKGHHRSRKLKVNFLLNADARYGPQLKCFCAKPECARTGDAFEYTGISAEIAVCIRAELAQIVTASY